MSISLVALATGNNAHETGGRMVAFWGAECPHVVDRRKCGGAFAWAKARIRRSQAGQRLNGTSRLPGLSRHDVALLTTLKKKTFYWVGVERSSNKDEETVRMVVGGVWKAVRLV